MASAYVFGMLEAVVPCGGGWRYPYPSEYSERLRDPFIRAETFRKLCNKVRLFRVSSGLRMGDVEFEVSQYIYSISPSNDRNRGRIKYEPRPDGRNDYRPPIERIRTWLVAMGQQRDLGLIHEYDAADRARICAVCPQNIAWKTECEPCNEDVEQRAKIVRAHPLFNMDENLKACRLHDMALQAAVFLDADHLPARHAEAPPDCWMKPS